MFVLGTAIYLLRPITIFGLISYPLVAIVLFSPLFLSLLFDMKLSSNRDSDILEEDDD